MEGHRLPAELMPAVAAIEFELARGGDGAAAGAVAAHAGETAERHAPILRFVGEEFTQTARARAFAPEQRARVGLWIRGGFDEQQTAHHRFAAAQPAQHETIGLARQRVPRGHIFRRAEQSEEDAHECLGDTPQRDGRVACGSGIG